MVSAIDGSKIGYGFEFVRSIAIFERVGEDPRTRSWQNTPEVNVQLEGVKVEGAKTKRYSEATTIAAIRKAHPYVRRYSIAD